MPLLTIQPTELDRAVADTIADHTSVQLEELADVLTWGADERVLCAAATMWWLYCRGTDRASRRCSDHILLTTLVSSALPHVFKALFDQERPDRSTITGHLRGIPYSGRTLDAFPSGHAVHIGALLSAATLLRKPLRNIVWSIGGILAATRVVLLAHWISDVLAGLAIGAAIERVLRPLTIDRRR